MSNYEEVEARLRERAPALAEAAIGCNYAVRLDRKRTVRGVIVEAELAYFRVKGTDLVGFFRVVIEAGQNRTRHTVHINTLPTR